MVERELRSGAARAAIRRARRSVAAPTDPDEVRRRLGLLERTRALRAAIGPVDLTIEELLDEEDTASDD